MCSISVHSHPTNRHKHHHNIRMETRLHISSLTLFSGKTTLVFFISALHPEAYNYSNDEISSEIFLGCLRPWISFGLLSDIMIPIWIEHHIVSTLAEGSSNES